MAKQHSRWLHLKMKLGLAQRGRQPGFEPREKAPGGGRLIKQKVGGTLGPAGRMNGE